MAIVGPCNAVTCWTVIAGNLVTTNDGIVQPNRVADLNQRGGNKEEGHNYDLIIFKITASEKQKRTGKKTKRKGHATNNDGVH